MAFNNDSKPNRLRSDSNQVKSWILTKSAAAPNNSKEAVFMHWLLAVLSSWWTGDRLTNCLVSQKSLAVATAKQFISLGLSAMLQTHWWTMSPVSALHIRLHKVVPRSRYNSNHLVHSSQKKFSVLVLLAVVSLKVYDCLYSRIGRSRAFKLDRNCRIQICCFLEKSRGYRGALLEERFSISPFLHRLHRYVMDLQIE